MVHCAVFTTARLLSQINPIHALPTDLFQIHFNIILPFTPSKWSLSLIFPHQNPVCTCPLTRTCHMPRPSHVITLTFGEEHKSRSYWRRPSVQPPFQSSPLGPNLPQHPIFEHSQRMCSLAHPLKFATNWSTIIVPFNTRNRSQCRHHSCKARIKTSASALKDRTRQMNTN